MNCNHGVLFRVEISSFQYKSSARIQSINFCKLKSVALRGFRSSLKNLTRLHKCFQSWRMCECVQVGLLPLWFSMRCAVTYQGQRPSSGVPFKPKQDPKQHVHVPACPAPFSLITLNSLHSIKRDSVKSRHFTTQRHVLSVTLQKGKRLIE